MQHPNRRALKSHLALLIAVVLVVAFAGGIVPARAATGTLVFSAIDTLDRNYVDPIHPIDLLNAAIATLRQQVRVNANVLPDIPAGSSLNEAQQQFLAEFDRAVQMGSESESQLAYDATAGTHWVFVDNVFPGSPAEAAGLKRFDKIVAVGGVSLRDASVAQASQLIRGPAGTPVVLTIERAGQVGQVSVTRASIQTRAVTSQLVEPGIVYVRLFEFSKGAARDLRSQLLGLAEQGRFRAVILDLRGNPGGLISEADGVASLFLPGGTPIARVIDRESTSVLRTMGQAPFAQVPLVVGRASCRE